MWHLMSLEGAEVFIGDATHTIPDGHPCVVVAVKQDTGLVELRFEDGTVEEHTPKMIGCYLLNQEHT